MGRDTFSSSQSTSSSNRFSFNNGHTQLNVTNVANNSSSSDLEAFGSEKPNKKSRTPSPPLSPDHRSLPAIFFKRRSGRNCLLITALAVGLLLPIWIITSGIITLDSFNDAIRYLPGYHYFANNLLYLVIFLLLVSFSVLATLPILPIFVLGLPFHLLIFSIFRKLMSDWVWWCVGCYVTLFLAPVGSQIVARCKTFFQNRRDPLIRHKSSSGSTLGISTKYTPLSNGTGGSVPFNNHGSVLSPIKAVVCQSLARMGERLEEIVFLFSKTNRTSTRWRLALAVVFFLSYVLPVTLNNESRTFNPARSAKSFDIQHPEPLCSARELSAPGYEDGPRHATFDGYWQEYLQFHREMVKPENEGGVPFNKKRFLVYQPSDDGLGNRLQALLSSVVLAMVSRRAIILDWVAMPQCNANFTDLFEHPPGLSWDMNTTLPVNFRDMPEYKKKPEIWYPYCRNCALRGPIDSTSNWSKLLCREDLGLNSTIPLVQIFSTQWFLPVIQHNPFWRSELCHMFPGGGENAFEVLAKTLLKPAKPVQDKIDQVMDRIPKDATLIGLQVRRTENNAVGHEIEDSFLSCADRVVEEEIAKAKIGGRTAQYKDRLYGRDEIVQQGHALRGVTRQESNSRSEIPAVPSSGVPKFAYYLATDYRPTRAHFQEILGDQLYVLDNTFSAKTSRSPLSNSYSEEDPRLDPESPSSLSPSTPQREAVARNSVQGVQTAVAEMFLLAQADRIISSPYSTFGYFAHGYANVQPNIVKRDGTCIHRKSTQPCFQYWFGFANGGASCPVRATIEMSEDYDCWL
ncbi:hypothetical protein BG000_011701 [Podila horticola]|nr:hypothetical protein BG000_011701 [Podila horticola]